MINMKQNQDFLFYFWRIYLDMKSTIVLAVLLSLLFVSCSSSEKEENEEAMKVNGALEEVLWLEGTWVDETTFGFKQPPQHLHETWKVYPDSISGIGYNVQGVDTSLTERIAIMVVNDKLTYVARPKSQALVTFTITSASSTEWVFENKANDFPQKLIYKKLPNDSLSVTLEGIQNAMERSIELKYLKIK